MLRVRWTLLFALWAARVLRQPTPPVRVSGGLLRGVVSPDGSHVAYHGIPYATIQERFQAPGPEPTWEGVFDATVEYVRCFQWIIEGSLVGQDDCLILNVYTPLNIDPDHKLPVMVFFHGGGFFKGSSTPLVYGPNYLVKNGVILVTVNYRLNIHGFLCLGIKEASGNAALKDQVSALKWVQRNIKAFGGDPDNVTIFGESAGSASVSYHVLSPMSKGLFHKAILQSGSSLSAWAIQYKPVYIASLLAKTMGYNTKNPYELYKYFMNKSDEELILTRVPRQEGNIITSEILFAPCVEKEIEGVESFITELPHTILSKGKYNNVPMMLGSNSEEGLLLAAMENDTTVPNILFEKSMPKDLIFSSEDEKFNVAKTLENFYMKGENISQNTIGKFSKLHGEMNLIYPLLEETELILNTNSKPVYSYVFHYYGRRSIPKMSVGRPQSSVPGATHADEIFYLFSQQLLPSLFENNMIDRMTRMWTNFAKFGDPTPEVTDLLPVKWLPANTSSMTSFLIDKKFSTIPIWYSDSQYIREIYSKYRRKKVEF